MAGNANSGKRREAKFYAALNLALSDEKEHPQALRKIAGNLVKQAMDGEQWAIKEVADRLDGKPAQTIAGDPDAPLTMVEKIERVIIDSSSGSNS